MNISFSNFRCATGGTVSGITLWSADYTKEYIDTKVGQEVADAIDETIGDRFSAYTPTSGFATINGSAITEGGNIVIEGGGAEYSAGTNIDITNNVISVTGITDDIDDINDRIDTVENDIADLQSDKLDGSAFTAYTANTQSIINSKVDSSAMTEYATTGGVASEIDSAIAAETARTELTYAKIGDIPSATTYSAGTNIDIDQNNVISVTGITYAGADTIGGPAKSTLGIPFGILETASTTDSILVSVSGITEYRNGTCLFVKNDITTFSSGATINVNNIGVKPILQNKANGYIINRNYTYLFVYDSVNDGFYACEMYNTNNRYNPGTNIQIVDNAYGEPSIISVTGITSYTGITSGDVITALGYTPLSITDVDNKLDSSAFTAYTSATQTELAHKQDASAMTEYATTAFTESTYLKEHQSLDNYYTSAQTQSAISAATQGMATTGWVESQGYLTQHQSLDNYYTKGEIDAGLQIFSSSVTSAITDAIAAETARTESTYLKEHQSLSAYSTTEQVNSAITSAITGVKAEIEGEIPTKVSDLVNDANFVNSGQVNTQIESKGYITGYTESDPVFMASAASGITSTDISNWNSKQPAGDYALRSELPTVPTSNTAFTNDAGYITSGDAQTQIDNSISGKQDTLVSGVNIKTINNQSILGSGNITIQGGGGANIIELTQAQYDALTAYTEDAIYVITDAPAYDISNYELLSNKVTSISSASTDTQYPTAKCVYDLIGDIETILASI